MTPDEINHPSANECDLCEEISRELLRDITPENIEYLRELAKKYNKQPGQVLNRLIELVRDVLAWLNEGEANGPK